jgi:membrane fusion protein, multidrug efflux system
VNEVEKIENSNHTVPANLGNSADSNRTAGASSPSKTQAAPEKKAPAKGKMSHKTRSLLIAFIVALLATGAGYFGYESYHYVSTDNAMVQAKATLLSSKVSGIIVNANVEENQKVKSGDVLVEIKTEDYQNVVDQLKSEQESLATQVKGAETNYDRTLRLFKRGASTQERLDNVETQFHSLQDRLKSAQAQVAEAELNLSYTKITAPNDGKVGKKSFEVGMLAAAGQPLLGFVAGNDRWVVANLKETDMALISEGKKAYVEVDAIPGREFEGVVESISPATGATFSLLPPDNATGNFTKVVQRVPVRIKLLNLSENEIDRLQSGLSAEVSVRVR